MLHRHPDPDDSVIPSPPAGRGARMSDQPAPSSSRNLLKTIPGLLISAFFLWYTFRGISFDQIRSLRLVHPAWILGVLGFTLAGYTLRCVRWTQMMPRGQRSLRVHFLVCARVLMTSLAANNILPLRIGDIMRVFTYAGDLGASPSTILSTVILEKLLDIFVLVLMFVSTVGRLATPHLRLIANISLAISAIGLLVLLVAARSLAAANPAALHSPPRQSQARKSGALDHPGPRCHRPPWCYRLAPPSAIRRSSSGPAKA